jgi:outer membrane protein
MKRRMSCGGWLLALPFLVGSPAASAEAPPVVTLEEAHRLALDHYEVIGSSLERIEQAQQGRRAATSALLPKVFTQGTYTHNITAAELEFEGQSLKILPRHDYELAIAFTQPLFDLPSVKARQQATLGVELANRSYETTAMDSLLGVTRAYYLVLAIQDNIEITRRSVEVNKETLRTAESLYRAGESVETAVLRARVAYAGAQRELLEAGNNLEIAKQQLSVLTGLKGDFRVLRPEKPRRPTETTDELVETGLRTRTELRGLTLRRRIGELQIQGQRSRYLPDIHLDGSFVKRRANFPSDTLSSVSVNATWTLFDGLYRESQVARARSELREVDLQLNLLRKQIEQEIRSARLEVQTQAASVDLLEQQVEFARKNADSTQKAYRVGEATDLDVLTSNEALTRSERQLALATYQLELAIFRLERAIGSFAQELIASSGGQE